jgi:hypothetical protein
MSRRVAPIEASTAVSSEHESDRRHDPSPPVRRTGDAADDRRPRPQPQPQPQPLRPAREPHFAAGRVACPRCKAHNDARASFCAVCGELLPAGLPRLREPEGGARADTSAPDA